MCDSWPCYHTSSHFPCVNETVPGVASTYHCPESFFPLPVSRAIPCFYSSPPGARSSPQSFSFCQPSLLTTEVLTRQAGWWGGRTSPVLHTGACRRAWGSQHAAGTQQQPRASSAGRRSAPPALKHIWPWLIFPSVGNLSPETRRTIHLAVIQ